MAAPTISALPSAPLRSEAPATFSTKAEAWVAALAGWTGEVNALAAYLQTLESGTLSALLAAIDGAGSGANKLAYYTGTNTVALADITAAGRALIAAADAAAARTALGLGTAATANVSDIKPTESLIVACSDETTALTAGVGKVTFRMPYAFTLSAVRASVSTAPTGSVLTVDINEGGVSILSTKLTIDAGEKTSTTAATAAVISDSALADDAEITIDIDGVGSSVAGAGLKVYLIGSRA